MLGWPRGNPGRSGVQPVKATWKDRLALVGYGLAFLGLVFLAAYIRHVAQPVWSSLFGFS